LHLLEYLFYFYIGKKIDLCNPTGLEFSKHEKDFRSEERKNNIPNISKHTSVSCEELIFDKLLFARPFVFYVALGFCMIKFFQHHYNFGESQSTYKTKRFHKQFIKKMLPKKVFFRKREMESLLVNFLIN